MIVLERILMWSSAEWGKCMISSFRPFNIVVCFFFFYLWYYLSESLNMELFPRAVGAMYYVHLSLSHVHNISWAQVHFYIAGPRAGVGVGLLLVLKKIFVDMSDQILPDSQSLSTEWHVQISTQKRWKLHSFYILSLPVVI